MKRLEWLHCRQLRVRGQTSWRCRCPIPDAHPISAEKERKKAEAAEEKERKKA
eukprot:COSAG02_NODE_2643_length_8346_cov_3.267127_1_plen_52_part_10